MERAVAAAAPEFGLRDKVGYALGDFGCNLSFALIGTYMMDFYTQYIGLTAATWAALIILVKIWDAVNDPIMGAVIDSRRVGATGKFKPWIKIGALGLTAAGALAFIPIPKASYPAKVAVCVASYLLWDFFYTIVNVPYGSLNSAISADPEERTSLSTWRSVGAGAGTLSMMALPALVYDEGDRLMGSRFIWIGLVLGLVALAAYGACIRMTTERHLEPAGPKRPFSYRETLRGFSRNRPLIAMCAASFALIVFFWSNQQTTKWLFQCYFGNARLSGIASIVSYLPLIVFIPFVGRLARRWGKKLAAGAPLLLSVVASIALLLFPLRPGDSTSTIVYIAGLMLIQLGGGAFQLICWAMITDCIDYQQLKTGRREEASVYAFYSFFRKLAQGVAASLVILCMTWVGYRAELGPDQAPGVPGRMKDVAIALMLVGSAAMALSLLILYTLGDKEVAEMGAALHKAPVAGLDVNEALERRND